MDVEEFRLLYLLCMLRFPVPLHSLLEASVTQCTRDSLEWQHTKLVKQAAFPTYIPDYAIQCCLAAACMHSWLHPTMQCNAPLLTCGRLVHTSVLCSS
jgi:hypothetical protein